MPSPVCHFEIMSHEAPELRAFYRDTFGWTIDEPVPGAPNSYALVRTGIERAISGGIGGVADGDGGHVTFYVGVVDMARAFEAIEKLGGSNVMGPQTLPDGLVVGYFRDPGANVIGLVQIPE
jgi:predicted enzyme related to lactoylglutathione lyase